MRGRVILVGAPLVVAACGALVGSSPDGAQQPADGGAGATDASAEGGVLDGGVLDAGGGDAVSGPCPPGTTPDPAASSCDLADASSCAASVDLVPGVVLAGKVCSGLGPIQVCPGEPARTAVLFHASASVNATLTVGPGVALSTNHVADITCAAAAGQGCANYGASAGTDNVISLAIPPGYFAIASGTLGCQDFTLEVAQ